MTYTYERKLGFRQAAVALFGDPGYVRTCESAVRLSTERYGVSMVSGAESAGTMSDLARAHVLVHGILCQVTPLCERDIAWAAGALSAGFRSISIACRYPDRVSANAAMGIIELAKEAHGDRLNVLRPDACDGNAVLVSAQKIADNAICDTVRVKYRPACESDEMVWSSLAKNEKTFFRQASDVYGRWSLFHRSASDGYFACRTRRGFAITATKTIKCPLATERIAEVIGYNRESNTLAYQGAFLPSSDAVEAAIVFAELDDVAAIVHTHASELFTRNPRFKSRVLVPRLPYGEPALGESVVESLRAVKDGFVIMEEHGEVFAGRDSSLLVKSVEAFCAGAAKTTIKSSQSLSRPRLSSTQ